jgi:glycolate oxidase iron-sulfur subunit
VQTNFSLAQLADPHVEESNRILRTCVHCGFCTATCPTYLLLNDELDSPRGRIYLIKDMLEQGRPATADVVTHIDRCLSCLSCMTTCPSGVHYMHLVDHARAHIEKTYKRPLIDRMLRGLLVAVLPDPLRFRRALMWAKLGRPFASLFERLGLKPVAAMLRLAPRRLPRAPRLSAPHVFPAAGPRTGRVALLAGCAGQVLQPSINDATIRLLNRCGIEVIVPPAVGCCGSLVHHMGREEAALAQARANTDAWMGEVEGEGLDAIVINASGCGTTVKDYGFMLRSDPAYAGKAARVAGLAQDVSEYLAKLALPPRASVPPLRIAYHAACSLQHGQKIVRQPKQLLAQAGFAVVDIPEGHLCCGSAGTYNILQSAIATELRDRKIERIDQLAPDVIAAGNIGCITQIASGTAIPVVHPVELIDWATGGPKPDGVAGRMFDAAARGELTPQTMQAVADS